MNFRIHIPETDKPLPDIKTGEGLLQWISTVDHKLIGIMYLWTAVFFFIAGFISLTRLIVGFGYFTLK